VLAHGALVLGLFGGGDVLEELLDQVHVREDHAAAAVALETAGVEGFAVMGIWLSEVKWKDGGSEVGVVGVLPFFDVGAERVHVLLPEVADDLYVWGVVSYAP